MKNILQAAALIVMAASAIVAAATSHQHLHEKCNHEWETVVAAGTAHSNNISATDSNFIQQQKNKPCQLCVKQ